MEETKIIKNTGKYNYFILLVSDRNANNYWTFYKGSSYRKALEMMGQIEVGTKETKNAYIQGIILTKEQQKLIGDELDEAISNAGLYDESSSIIRTKGEW